MFVSSLIGAVWLLAVFREQKFDENLKRKYFVDHNTKTTSWQDPRPPILIPRTNLPTAHAVNGNSSIPGRAASTSTNAMTGTNLALAHQEGVLGGISGLSVANNESKQQPNGVPIPGQNPFLNKPKDEVQHKQGQQE